MKDVRSPCLPLATTQNATHPALTRVQLLLPGSASSLSAPSGVVAAIAAHKAVDAAADTEVSVIPFPSGAGGRLVAPPSPPHQRRLLLPTSHQCLTLPQIVSPTGPLDRDYDDGRRAPQRPLLPLPTPPPPTGTATVARPPLTPSRRFFDAAERGVDRAVKVLLPVRLQHYRRMTSHHQAGAKRPLLFVCISPPAAARFPHACDAAVLGAATAMCDLFSSHIVFM